MDPLGPKDPSTVGPYRLLARLGAGGMGEVYLGRGRGGRLVAIKVVHRDLVREPDFRRRFRTEVEALRRVSGTWTAPVLGCDTESPVPWVATGYVAGPSLRHVVGTLHGPLAEHSVWALAHGLALALSEIHTRGLIHRDLKPSNVMVTLDGPKIIDFGIVRALDASVETRTGSLIGSPGYMPPEQIRGEDLTHAVDVFALGAVLSYAGTGQPPFSPDGAHLHTVLYRVMHEPPALGLPSGRAELGRDLREVVTGCLAKTAGERPTLPEIASLAERRMSDEFWLPQDLTVRLGRDAAELLAFEGPLADQPFPPGGPEPHASPSARSVHSVNAVDDGDAVDAVDDGHAAEPVAPDQTTYVSRVFGPRGTPTRRRRRRHLLTAGALALAVVAALVAWNTVGDGDAGQGGPGGTEAAGDGTETSRQRDAGLRQAPLSHLVPQDVRDAGGLTVHLATRDEPILFMEDGEGSPSGFEADLIREIGKQLGVEIRFSVSADSSTAADAAVREGEEVAAHVALAGFPDNSEDREQLGVDFVNHFVDGWAVVSDDPGFTGAFGELCGLKVTTYEGGFMEDVIHRNTEGCAEPVEVQPFPSRDDMAASIRAGDADAALLLYSQADSWVGEHPDSGLRVSFDTQERGTRGIAVPVGQPELRDALMSAIGALLENGTYQQLLERWDIPQAGVKRPAVNTGG